MSGMHRGMFQPIMKVLLALVLALASINASALDRITYYHNDALGSPVAATNNNGDLLWREAYEPYGKRILRQASSKEELWYTGKQEEIALGVNYFGARWYEPEIGRFMGIDPVGVDPGNVHSFNRYAYANNNPYVYVDPDGRDALYGISRDIAEMQGRDMAAYDAYKKELGKDVLGFVFIAGVTVVSDGLLTAPVAAILYSSSGDMPLSGAGFTKGETETVQRWMSKAELESTQNTGLLRGGREGTHYVTDSANSSAQRARQRLALPQTPEVKVTLEVPAGEFSTPSKVEPAFNMPGGGMERTATGDIPVNIKKVE